MFREIWEWVRSIIIAIILALLFRIFLLEHFLVDGASMYPTLRNSERIIVNKLVYRLYEPARGDIIVFNHQDRRDFIKRVVGLPGEEVRIKASKLFINDQSVEEPYLFDVTAGMFDFGPVTVPEDHLFVLGDNRANSRDSRYADVSFVSMEEIKGRAYCVFWPIGQARILH